MSPALSEFDFCRGLSESSRIRLAELISPVELGEHQIVFRTGDPADNSYLIEEGLVSLEICAPGVGCRRMMTAGRGELIGWSPLVEGARYAATARTVGRCRLLKISGSALREACTADPRFGFEIMRSVVQVLSTRINAARLQILDLFGPEGAGHEREPASFTSSRE